MSLLLLLLLSEDAFSSGDYLHKDQVKECVSVCILCLSVCVTMCPRTSDVNKDLERKAKAKDLVAPEATDPHQA